MEATALFPPITAAAARRDRMMEEGLLPRPTVEDRLAVARAPPAVTRRAAAMESMALDTNYCWGCCSEYGDK